MDVDSPSVVPETPDADDYGSVAGRSERNTAEPSEGSGATPTSAEFPGKDGLGVDGIGIQSSAGHVVVRELELDGQDDEVAGGQEIASVKSRDRASSVASSIAAAPATNLKASTSRKRKLADSPGSTPAPPDDSTSIATSPILVPTPIPGFFTTRNHPMNKAAFRYTACGPSPNSRERCPLYRVIPSPPSDLIRFSWEDRSPYVYISPDAAAITTEKGFRGARANVPLREGAWYYEVIVEKGAGDPSAASKSDGLGPHVRIGVGRRESPLNAPVGFDGYSYGIRDKTGDKVHLSVPKAYGEGFGTGDVIGVYLSLPPRPEYARPITAVEEAYNKDVRNPARIVRKRVPIRYKGQLYFESMEYAPSKEMEDLAYMTKDPVGFNKAALELQQKQKSAPPPGKKKAPPPPVPPPPRPLATLPGSKLAFFKNGECQGVAYKDLLDWLPLKQHSKREGQPTPRVSTSTAITMARENHHDDGTLGYYPIVSVFGGGIARINAGPDFKYPPRDLETQIASASSTCTTPRGSKSKGSHLTSTPWRPLCERYAEYFEEERALDEIDDHKAIEAFQATMGQYTQPSSTSLSSAPVSTNSRGSGGGAGKASSSHQAKKKTALSNELELVVPESRGSSDSPGPGVPLAMAMHREVEERRPSMELEISDGLMSMVEREERLEGQAEDSRVEQIVKMELD